MTLKSCKECKKKISTEARTCPNCGVPNPTLENENIYEKIWLSAKIEYDICDMTYQQVTSNIERDDAKRLYDIKLYFYRGMYEAACEKFELEKKNFKKAVIYCFRRSWDVKGFDDVPDEKKDRMSKQSYEATEDGLKYDDIIGKMSQGIIDSGKKSFKSNQGGACMSALVKLWKDKTIDFKDSPLEKNVKNFFKKIF
jgi:hypothetical protein